MPTLFHFKVRQTARTPTFSGTETSSWSDVSKTLSAWADALGWEDVESVGDLTDNQRSEAAEHSLLGEVGAETWRELIFFPVVNPSTSDLNRGALQAVLGGRGSQADIPNDALNSAQNVAERLLDEEFGDEDEEESADEPEEVRSVENPFVIIEDEMPSVKGRGEMQIIDPGYPTKATGTVKQVDTSTRIVTGYYASFGTVDADREEFAPGAFEDTVRRRGPQGSGRIKHLWQHDPKQPIGVPETLREDERGLYFETRIVDTQKGTDALKLYEEGVITEHSVGFNRIDQEPREDGSTLITEVQLWEGSSVTWGANPNTPATGLKGPAPSMETLAEKAQAMRRVLSRGISEATAAQVEVGLKQLESHLSRMNRETKRSRKLSRKGDSLAAVLDEAIDQRVEDEEDTTRGDVQQEMADAAGIAQSTVQSILQGDDGIECPPLQRLSGFADVLPVTRDELVSAAEQDGCEYEESSYYGVSTQKCGCNGKTIDVLDFGSPVAQKEITVVP